MLVRSSFRRGVGKGGSFTVEWRVGLSRRDIRGGKFIFGWLFLY